jgi:hypothetical protein
MQMSARTRGSRNPISRSTTLDPLMATTARSQAFKWSKANWISWVTSLFENPPYFFFYFRISGRDSV